MPMAVATRCIRAAFGLEAQRGLHHGEVHRAQHVGQHMVGLDQQAVGLQLDRHMAVAQVVGRAGQVKRCAVVGAGGDHQHGLRRSNHLHQRAVFGHQHVASPHQRATWQEHTEFAPFRVGRVKAAFLAHVPVEFHRGGAFQQDGCQAFALGDEFGGLEH